MSKVAITEVSMEKYLSDMLYEILFEIFRRLPKDRLIEISRLCLKFRDVAGDTRFWKDVCIRYKPHDKQRYDFTFEELYSEPWPVKVVDLSSLQIRPPVSSKSDQVVYVTKLFLSPFEANKVTTEAILAKYRCTELYLDRGWIDVQGHIMGIAPETFSKQTNLEVLSLRHVETEHSNFETNTNFYFPSHLWLAPILNNCKNLKTLDLSFIYLTNSDMLGFVGNLPRSLEKLVLQHYDSLQPEDSFFEWLAKSSPNLRELVLSSTNITKCPSLLKFKFLETLHFTTDLQDVNDSYMCTTKFPALKTVFVSHHHFTDPLKGAIVFEKARKTLEPHDIIVNQKKHRAERPYPEDGKLWEV